MTSDNPYLSSIYIVLGMIDGPEMIKNLGGCVWVIYRHCAILYKGLVHLWVLVSLRVPGPTPLWISKDYYIHLFSILCDRWKVGIKPFAAY